MVGEKNEMIITVNISKAYKKPTSKRARTAINLLREIVARNMKADVEMVAISNSVNNAIVAGKYKTPLRSLKVKVIVEEGRINVMLPDEKIEKVSKEEKKPETKKVEEKPVKAVKSEKPEKHIGGERKAPGSEEKTADKIIEEKERQDLNKMKKG